MSIRRSSVSGLKARFLFIFGDSGQVELGYILTLALVVVPLYVAVQMLFQVLLNYYENISFFVSIPFP